MDTATADLLAFLAASLGTEVGPDDDYFAAGLTDSLFALELVSFVEHRFQLTIEVEDLHLDHFRTATRVLAFVQGKGPEPITSRS
ncbi:acyl carrier protein [Streptomyces botrytidirepellens]|uniref:Acyl carrier protein n=1 Tax=Streptomyces botrytidirepellens TaxID=2486417 RepID=A0A3M8VKR9_9ACTN|nr:acyl carrier protein [Streptomyces botrytidirepellens]RNG18238.1 acyl carrier protein [Streptomyces botrytidirepellens]